MAQMPGAVSSADTNSCSYLPLGNQTFLNLPETKLKNLENIIYLLLGLRCQSEDIWVKVWYINKLKKPLWNQNW